MNIEPRLVYEAAFAKLGIEQSRLEQIAVNANHLLKIIPDSAKVTEKEVCEAVWRLSKSTYFVEPEADPTFSAAVQSGTFLANKDFFLEEIYDEAIADSDIRRPLNLAVILLQKGAELCTDESYLFPAIREVAIIGTICREVDASKFDSKFEVKSEVKRDCQILGFDSAATKKIEELAINNPTVRTDLRRQAVRQLATAHI